MWQPIFRFLPEETQLKNPDSYIALLRDSNKEEVDTPTTGDDIKDRVLGMIQHICMRGAEIIGICKNQLDQFDNEIVPEPLQTLKTFRLNYNKKQLGTLIEVTLKFASTISQMVINHQIHININDPVRTTLDEATGQLNDNVITVDYIQSQAVQPHVATLAKVFMILGLQEIMAKAVALSLNHMVDKRLMSSETLKPTNL